MKNKLPKLNLQKNKKVEETFEKPEDINPEITKKFVNFINKKSEVGAYRVEVKIGDKIIPIDVFPTVFPPKSDYSVSSKSVFEAFGNLEEMEVADVGSGSGIESIVSVMAGAKHVDAADINRQAVDCSKHNVEINNFQDKVSVFYSNLFKNFPKKKYDMIIGNLPIVNFNVENNPTNNALYDNNFEGHKRFFQQAKEYLAENGIMIFTHANLQSANTANSNYDFEVLEKLVDEYGYEVSEKIEREDMGYKWINYKIKLKK